MSRVTATKSCSRRNTAPSYGFGGRGTRAHRGIPLAELHCPGDGVSGAISFDAPHVEPVAASSIAMRYWRCASLTTSVQRCPTAPRRVACATKRDYSVLQRSNDNSWSARRADRPALDRTNGKLLLSITTQPTGPWRLSSGTERVYHSYVSSTRLHGEAVRTRSMSALLQPPANRWRSVMPMMKWGQDGWRLSVTRCSSTISWRAALTPRS